VLEEYTTKEQRSVVRLCGQKGSMQRVFINKYLLFTVGRFVARTSSQLSCKSFADDEEVKAEVRKCLRQESKDFYAAGVDALVKRWDKCISVGGGYVEKCFFFARIEYHMFYVLYPFVSSLLTLPRSQRTAAVQPL
jgi:hypothetical protein